MKAAIYCRLSKEDEEQEKKDREKAVSYTHLSCLLLSPMEFVTWSSRALRLLLRL